MAEKKSTKSPTASKSKPASKAAAKKAAAKPAAKKVAKAAKPAAKKVVKAAAKKPAAKKAPAKKAAKAAKPAKPAAKKPAAKKAAKKPAAKKSAVSQHSLRIRLRGFDFRQLDQATEIIVNTVRHSGASILGPIPLPTSKTRYDLLRSPFVDKDSREQIEIRTYHRLVDIPNPSEKTAQALAELQMPDGVSFNMNLK